MAKRVVVAGGGIAGSYVAKLLENDADVTLIDSKEYFEIRFAALRGLVDEKFAPTVVTNHSSYLKRATVVVGLITSVENNEVHLEDGSTVPFDYLVIATGSSPHVYQRTLSERLQLFTQQRQKIQAADHILVVGGGPVGVEFTGEVVTEYPNKKVTIVHGGSRLMEFMKEKGSTKALKWLQSKGVDVIFNDKADVKPEMFGTAGEFTLKSGRKVSADYLFLAIGSRPELGWLQGSFAAALDNGRVDVDEFFKVKGFSNVFAIGDSTNVKEAKQGYFAKMHAANTAHNIKQLIHNPGSKKLKKYSVGPDIALVSLGRKNGVAQLPFGTFMGFLPTAAKSSHLFVSKSMVDLGVKTK